MPRMASGKTLPCFAPFDGGARSNGFVGDRFLSGACCIRPQPSAACTELAFSCRQRQLCSCCSRWPCWLDRVQLTCHVPECYEHACCDMFAEFHPLACHPSVSCTVSPGVVILRAPETQVFLDKVRDQGSPPCRAAAAGVLLPLHGGARGPGGHHRENQPQRLPAALHGQKPGGAARALRLHRAQRLRRVGCCSLSIQRNSSLLCPRPLRGLAAPAEHSLRCHYDL